MDSLLQEIYDHICIEYFKDQLDEQRKLVPFAELPFTRPLLATISRKWQWAVERQSFHRICMKSTELESFRQIIIGHRRRFIKSIRYTIILPDYSLEDCTQFERESDRQANDIAFTTALHGLFQILQPWGMVSDSGSPYAISVSLENIYSSMDYDRRAPTGSIGQPRASTELQAARVGGESTRPRDIMEN